MTADPFWNNVRSLFQTAAELPRDRRAEFLDRECRDAAMRAEVESLLEAHDNAGTFLEKSIWDLIDANDPHRLAGTAIGPYRLVRPLGHGGMGTVFLAVRADADFDQRVAIKLVRGGTELIARFRQERQILAALEHPNIARLIDGGTTADGLPYLVMEYVDGSPIDEYVRELSLEERLRLFLQLCDAVQHAHRSLVIHRDLKPGNVLVTRGGTLKLLDFGIAKLTSQVSETSTRLMTPEYASPEQLAGLPVTTASDVYSLGLILRELLVYDKLSACRPGLSLSPTWRACPTPKLRGDLETIVSTALAHEPARRYASVEKFADDIRNYLAGRPIAARPATFVYRSSKFVRRNKLGVAAVIAIIAITTIAFIATLQQKRVAERRFDEVRSLAHSVVFELHDAIATLPGSTAARALLVKRALVYLDHLAEEASDNTPLQLELARAYLKIGDVQGLPYSANLGDSTGAMRSYRKALSIAQGVPADDGDASLILADAHDHIGFVEERALHWPVALREHQAALAIRSKIAHSIEGDFAQARTLVSIGDCMYVGENQIPAVQLTPAHGWYERSLQVLAHIPPSADRLRVLHDSSRANQRLGSFWTYRHDLKRALQYHDAALTGLEECMRLAPDDATARRNYADQLVMKATAQNTYGDIDGVIEGTQRALPILDALAAADPKNSEAQHDLAFAHEQLALGLIRKERWSDARAQAEQVLAIRQKLIAADPNNREDRRDMMRTYGVLIAIEKAAGNESAVAELEAKSKTISREVAR
ncbi:MAG TPA: serine/threonine-protein kinase [Thermoanaerobaculia bacterium]|nr:serine/threonine-protein kinase [Thermoanaerobaculia bacterium]